MKTRAQPQERQFKQTWVLPGLMWWQIEMVYEYFLYAEQMQNAEF